MRPQQRVVAQGARRGDLPLLPVAQDRGSMEDAKAVLLDPARKAGAVAALERAFFANSSRLAQSRKRANVELLAKLAQGGGVLYPLQRATVVAVAAALKAAAFRSGDQYLGELCLGHVEAGFEIPAWLARTFDQSKMAVLRGMGPPKRAGELKLQDVAVDARLGLGSGPDEVWKPWDAYVVACAWLLREIELAGARVGHVTFDANMKTATILLPVSKCDTGGTGVSRTRRCTCLGSETAPACPYHVLWRLVEAVVHRFSPESARERFDLPVCPTNTGYVPAKCAMIAAWRGLAPEGGEDISGHAARRSGAKALARAGWSVLAIQHLGRWASAQVLEYVEEAYAERAGISLGEGAGALPGLEERVRALEAARVAAPVPVPAPLEAEAFAAPAQGAPAGAVTWVVLCDGPTRRVHVQASTHPSTPSWAWVTRCGWRFANAGPFRLLEAARLPEPVAWCRK